MLVYHGTTAGRARMICKEGFLPKKPSRRVWFAESWDYALRRARQQARRTHDSPVVLTCELDKNGLKTRYGSKRVVWQNGIIAIKASVPVQVLRSFPAPADQPSSPHELADWVNHVLRRKRTKGVSQRDPGILRLSTWVVQRLANNRKGIIRPTELFEMARQFLPEEFAGQPTSEKRLRSEKCVQTIEVEAAVTGVAPMKETEALDLMSSDDPTERIRGLRSLAELGDPDLAEWCAMFFDDASVDAQVTAIRLLLECDDAEVEELLPLAEADHKRVRAAALAALARHDGEDAPHWCRRGLEDPEACVRVEVALQLERLDARAHKDVFLVALHDPNPDVERIARELTASKGYRKAATGWAYNEPPQPDTA